jgi:hypothetical protein
VPSLYVINPRTAGWPWWEMDLRFTLSPGIITLFDARFADALAEMLKFCITGTLAHRREFAVKP